MITITNIPYANSFYDRVMIERFLPNLLHGLFAQVRDVPMNNSNVIKFRGYSALDITTDPRLTEGVTPVGMDLTTSKITATLEQCGKFVEYTDVVVQTSEDPALAELSTLIGENAGQNLDILTREVLVAGTSVQYASTAVARAGITAAMTLCLTEVREAVRTMKVNNVPKITKMQTPNGNTDTIPGNACYVGIIHPNVTLDLKNDPNAGFVEIQHYPDGGVNALPGEVGRMDEVRFIESSFATPFDGEGAGGVDVYPTIILGADAYGVSRITSKELEMIVHNPGETGAADPLNQRGSIAWKTWFVAKITRQLGILRIEHGCSVDA
jgi:N4-gp56 family major capsid protein